MNLIIVQCITIPIRTGLRSTEAVAGWWAQWSLRPRLLRPERRELFAHHHLVGGCEAGPFAWPELLGLAGLNPSLKASIVSSMVQVRLSSGSQYLTWNHMEPQNHARCRKIVFERSIFRCHARLRFDEHLGALAHVITWSICRMVRPWRPWVAGLP